MKSLSLAAACSLALAASPAAADPLRDAAQKALDTNPEVAAKLDQFRAAVDAVDIARAGWRPQVSVDATVAHDRDRITSRNPATGQPYGPDFPAITVVDIITAQRLMLARLGVKHLVAVMGTSYGGYQAFQWAVTHPEAMNAVVCVNTAPKGSGA